MNGRTNSTKDGDTIINGALIPLEQVTQFAIVPRDGAALLTWVDPIDKTATPGGEMVAEWDHTDIIRKINSAPTSIDDGELAVRETTRNNYQTAGFIDNNLQNNHEYYYSAFAVSKYNVPNEPVSSSVIPVMATPEYVTTLHRKGFEPTESSNNPQNDECGISASDSNVVIAGGLIYGYSGWAKSTTVTTVNRELSQSTLSNLSFSSSPRETCGNSTLNHHLFYNAKGYYQTYDIANLTKSGMTVFFGSTSNTRTYTRSSVSFNGNTYMHTGSSGSDIPETLYRVNPQLTISSVGTLTERKGDTLTASNNNYMMFAGGHRPGSMDDTGQLESTDGYNSDITHITTTDMRSTRRAFSYPNGSGCSVGDYLLFVGGYGNHSSSSAYWGENTVDAYDSNLTRVSVSNLPASGYEKDHSDIAAQKCGTNAVVLYRGLNDKGSVYWYDSALTRSGFTFDFEGYQIEPVAAAAMDDINIYVDNYSYLFVIQNR